MSRRLNGPRPLLGLGGSSAHEIAGLALFPACDDSSYVYGVCIAIDGGKIVSE